MVGREIAALDYVAAPDRETGRPRSRESFASQLLTAVAGRTCATSRFSVRAGEVLGVAGLLGAGRTELLEAMFGASPYAPTGTIRLEGQPVRFTHPDQAIKAGIAMTTEDRKTLGLFDRMTVAENITLRRLPELTLGPLVDPRAERRAVDWSVKELAIKTAGGDVPVTSLSGGNQQKCILARWLLIEPKVLLLDEPTRGIDVGAKAEIYQLIRRLASKGRAIVMTSSELPELLAVSDRIIVLCEGRLAAEIPRARPPRKPSCTPRRHSSTGPRRVRSANHDDRLSATESKTLRREITRCDWKREMVMRVILIASLFSLLCSVSAVAADFPRFQRTGDRPTCRRSLLCGHGRRCERRPEARRRGRDRGRGDLVREPELAQARHRPEGDASR